MKCDVDVRKGLCSNVLLSGGITMVTSIDKPMTNELIALAPTTNDLICFIEKKKEDLYDIEYELLHGWFVCS